MGPAFLLPFAPLLAVLYADPINLNAAVLAEGRAGESPLQGGGTSQAFAAAVVTPQLLGWLREDQLDLRLVYFPRFTWQTPNLLGYGARPLILHQASLSLSGRLSPRTEVHALAFGSIGQPDYAILPTLLGMAGQGTLPTVQSVETISASAGMQTALDRRWRLTLGAEYVYYRAVGEVAPVAGVIPISLPRQTTVVVTPGVTYRLTPIDSLLFGVPASYTVYRSPLATSGDLAFYSATPTVEWRARRAGGTEYRLAVGVAFTRYRGAMSGLDGTTTPLPTGSAEVGARLYSEDAYGLFGRLRVTFEQYLDPVLVSIGPRVYASGQLTGVFAPNWSVGVLGDVSVASNPKPLEPALALQTVPDETAFSLRVPVRHRFTSNVVMELGGFWGDRAPAINSAGFGVESFHQRQLWAYVALTATTQDLPGFVGH